MTDAESARFQAFVASTVDDERDYIAFLEFEEAIHNAVMSACMINMYDGGEEWTREKRGLQLALSGMLFRVLPRVDLGPLIGCAEGIGYALQYGIIEPKPEALDHITSTEDLQALADKGYEADRLHSEQRMAEMVVRQETKRSRKSSKAVSPR